MSDEPETDEITAAAAGDDRPALERQARITPYPDGPYLIRGSFLIDDLQGVPIDPGRRTVALCRCGRSAIRPFCDGTHKVVGFTAPSGPEPRS